MHIVIDALSSVSGGAESYLRNCLPRLYDLFLASKGEHKFTILAFKEQTHLFPLVPKSACFLIEKKRISGFKLALWQRFSLRRIVKDLAADVLFTPYQVGRPYPGVKRVVMFRNMDPFTFHKYKYGAFLVFRKTILKWESIFSMKHADRVIAVSEYVKNFAEKELKIDSNKVFTIHHGRDLRFCPEADLEKDSQILNEFGISTPFIFTCGLLWPYRRCEDVIRAFDGAINLDNNCHLVICGTGFKPYVRFIEKCISQSKRKNNIRMLGNVSVEAMQVFFRKCKICVIATEVEACPNIAIEALSSGSAIISADNQPLTEIFANSVGYFSSRNTKELAIMMNNVFNDPQEISNLKCRALKRASAFSWDQCAIRTYSALVNWQI